MSSFTSRDVGRLAGVSQSTVSYVMSGRRPISPTTRARVQAAIDELTYQPHAGARALASRRTQLIGLVVPFGRGADASGQLPFIESIASIAREHDYEMLLSASDEGASGLERLAGRKLCDAIVLMDVRRRDSRVAIAAQLGIPVVLIGVPEDRAELPCVDIDYEAAGRLAVEHLAETGHDRVKVLGHPERIYEAELNFLDRFSVGVRDSAIRLGLPLEEMKPVEWERDAMDATVHGLLNEMQPSERLGLILANPGLIVPAMHALSRHGIAAGRDLSVVAMATEAEAEASDPPVTYVRLNPQEVSQRAMATLFSMLDNDSKTPVADVELVSPHIVSRDSVLPQS